ncbi:hypothetical protein Cni_G03966 [Canna indica]|uniref:Uncharacterized protein n=1 Tax=Canna indica TaxID=4628 RepID=A0AAQ3Q413_9LILI|nr:hypothetical protein Cni_G03966 [Canna indica]
MKQRCLALLQSCASMNELRQIHAQLHSLGLAGDRFLASEMLRFCALSPRGNICYARSLILSLVDPMLSSWNHVIRGYSQSDLPREALLIFIQMRRRGHLPNELTFPFVLKACANLMALQLGMQIHAGTLKGGVHHVVYVQNALMNLYGSCGQIDETRRLFDGMSLRTVVSWNTILSACISNSLPEEWSDIFLRMRSCGFEPDQTTYVILLSAGAELGRLSFGKWLHGQIIESELPINVQLGTAIVNMYAKCGLVTYASRVFDRMPVKNVWTWSSMILGLAQHGSAREAIELFQQMKNASVRPNYVTFLGVLCACSHAGLVDDGYKFFHEMVEDYGINPMMTHYSAMVDVLGRKGHLLEAYDFIQKMPIEPDAVVWRTLLSACQLHAAKDVNEIGKEANRRLLVLEPKRSGNYVMAANLYSEEGLWEEAARLRRMMREEGLKKVPGESCIEVAGIVCRFISGDDSCNNTGSICKILNGLELHMKMPYSFSMDCR